MFGIGNDFVEAPTAARTSVIHILDDPVCDRWFLWLRAFACTSWALTNPGAPTLGTKSQVGSLAKIKFRRMVNRAPNPPHLVSRTVQRWRLLRDSVR